jgi:hypothetical protein
MVFSKEIKQSNGRNKQTFTRVGPAGFLQLRPIHRDSKIAYQMTLRGNRIGRRRRISQWGSSETISRSIAMKIGVMRTRFEILKI